MIVLRFSRNIIGKFITVAGILVEMLAIFPLLGHLGRHHVLFHCFLSNFNERVMLRLCLDSIGRLAIGEYFSWELSEIIIVELALRR